MIRLPAGLGFLLACCLLLPEPSAAAPASEPPSPPASSAPKPLPAKNPADRELEKLATDATRLGKAAEGVVPLIELFDRWDEATPERTLRLLERVASDKRLSPARKVLADGILARAQVRMGRGDLHEPFEKLGYVTRFRVIGPFDNEGKSGFDRELAPEAKRTEPADLSAEYEGRERTVRWRDLPEPIARQGYVSLSAILRPRQNVCALAETYVHSDSARDLSLWLGAGGAIKAYWNGELVLHDEAYRLPSPDRSVAMVKAVAGANRLLVKSCVMQSAWGFFARIGDASGGVASGIKAQLEAASASTSDAAKPSTGASTPQLTARKSTPLEAPLAQLERAASGDKPKAKALAALASYLQRTGSDDPAERRAKQLAARAAELEPSLPHLMLAAQLAEERGDIMRYADQAGAKHPTEPRSLLLRASVRSTGPVPEEALPLVAQIPETSSRWASGQLLRASVLRDLGLSGLAISVGEQVKARVGNTPDALRALAELYQAGSRPNDSLDKRRELLAIRADDIGSRRVLITDALQRGAIPELLAHLDAMQDVSLSETQSLLYLAGIYDALERDDMVLSTLRAAIELVPEAAELHSEYARALLRVEQPELAAEALQKALALKPQDAASRELLEQIRPKPRDDEAYAVPSEELLALRSDGRGYSSTVLSTLQVNTVFENGLGSSFRQHVVQLHDDEATRQYRTFPIQYDPDAQRVDVRLARVYRKNGRVLEAVRSYEQALGEPWYRIYYDTRARVIVLPDLEPGDVIEVRYRVDDIAHRNLFADYYGDLHPLKSGSPTLRSKYVLITPKQRKIFVHAPSFVARTEQVVGRRSIQTFVAENLPAIVPETGMPGLIELSPYLHVSTYGDWKDVGRWYWGLIKDQLYADAQLKQTVAELVTPEAGKPAKSVRDKVTAIHHWVVKNTRYVGLEFGIHGFMPYRVPLVVQRGFGDCKDKASLLYTMFREAGIDARIVLVRTRRNGAIETHPASLAVFDHAIAYVPELDLYLDGTAEHSGTRELPVQDQGVMVLVVGPKSAELKKTPVLDAQQSRRTRKLTATLALDGSATVKAEEEVVGGEAAGYREHYEAVGTRKDRFERALGQLYPGLTLEETEFQSLTDLEEPVRYKYTAQVPQLATWDGDELRLAPSTVRDLLTSMARLPQRKHPLDLQGNHSYVEERTVILPAELRATSVPAGGEVSSEFGRVKLEVKAASETVTAHTELTVARDRIEPSEYGAFRDWVEKADRLLRQRIGLRKQAASGGSTP